MMSALVLLLCTGFVHLFKSGFAHNHFSFLNMEASLHAYAEVKAYRQINQ